MKRKRIAGALGVTVLFLVLLIAIVGSTQARVSASPRAAPATTWVVTSTADSGPGTLRQALLDAAGGDTITFDPAMFPPGNPVTITLTSGRLPDIAQGNLTIDASDAGVVLDGSSLGDPAADGLRIASDGNVVQGLQIRNFPGAGIQFDSGASDNLIGGSNTTPGGLCSGACNLISGNGNQGINVWGSGTTGNTISGNYVGTNASGTAALPNGGYWGVGIGGGAQNNHIGGDSAAERNLISGNLGNGIEIQGNGTTNNTVTDNYIGTDASGMAALPNGHSGVSVLWGAQENSVGGSLAGEGNLISGNTYNGVSIQGSGTMSNTVSGNLIGVDATGVGVLGNSGNGIWIGEDAQWNVVGGTTPEERNIISGNGEDGVQIAGSETLSNTVSGNYVGTDVSGTSSLPNGNDGVRIENQSSHNVIGGDSPAERNVVSGNNWSGISMGGSAAQNLVIGNYIGTDASGSAPLGNGQAAHQAGVAIYGNAHHNRVEGNVISGNNSVGVAIDLGSGTDHNAVVGNYIGTDASGATPLGNTWTGLYIADGASDNLIGGATLAEGNLIAHNGEYGLFTWGENTLRNTFSHNRIYGNGTQGIELTDGGNLELFAPMLIEVTPDAVSGLAVPGSTVEVFTDDGDQGRTFEGSATADGSGSFSLTQPGGFALAHVTATTTDAEGNTSEFSAAYAPGRDVAVAAVYVPQSRQEIDVPLTPLVRVGNGGTVPETFVVTAVITHAGLRVYQDQQTVTNLGPLHYQTLVFSPWTPVALGSHAFEATVQPATPDDDPTNDRMNLAFSVVDSRVDLWSRDNPDDDGQEPAVGPVWQSPDLWVRNQADGLPEPQDPINNITNTVYVRVRNRGNLTATGATVTVYWHPPALAIGQSWWQPIGTADVGDVAPGEIYTMSMEWLPQISGVLTVPYHTCLIDVISSTKDLPPEWWDVAGSNNIEQRNVDIISPTAGMASAAASATVVSTTFSVGNPYAREDLVDVLVDAARVPSNSEVRLDLGKLFDRWLQVGQDSLSGATIVSGTTQIALPGGGQAVVGGLPLAAEELVEVSLEVRGLGGRQAQIDVSERIGGVVLGGSSLQVQGWITHEIYLPLVLRSSP